VTEAQRAAVDAAMDGCKAHSLAEGAVEGAAAAVSTPLPAPQTLASSMQSIETAIVYKAMQRISSLFQQAHIPASSAGLSNALHSTMTEGAGMRMHGLPCSGGSSAFVPLGLSSMQPVSEACRGHTAAAPSQTSPVLHQQNDGAFCGDSDVVGDVKVRLPRRAHCVQAAARLLLCQAHGAHAWSDATRRSVQEVNSGGGTGTSQAFSEVGVDGGSHPGTVQVAAAATAKAPQQPAGPDDSGSSHVCEPPHKRQALQQHMDASRHPSINLGVQLAAAAGPTQAREAHAGARLRTHAAHARSRFPAQSTCLPSTAFAHCVDVRARVVRGGAGAGRGSMRGSGVGVVQARRRSQYSSCSRRSSCCSRRRSRGARARQSRARAQRARCGAWARGCRQRSQRVWVHRRWSAWLRPRPHTHPSTCHAAMVRV
jgi:hypothetical protein